ncbi:MAG: cytochrome c biogenesis protein CcsA [Prevotella sp.]|nr:cytochrome c biogenesis protein CcsA [Prevotella sp.]
MIVAAVVIVMAIATIVEKIHGTTFVSTKIYSTWWFSAIWGILAIASIARIITSGMQKTLTVLMLHISFVVILAGALTTHLTSKKGYLHLRCGETARLYTEQSSNGDMQTATLPFSVKLNDFNIKNYEGTTTHSDYASHLTFSTDEGSTNETVSMNNIAVVEGYRFYQTSFDRDMKGSILTVTYDPYGTGITYIGYGLLIVSAILLLLLRTPRIKQLYRQLNGSRVLVIGCLVLAATTSFAKTPVVAREDAEKAERKLIVYNGRVCPLNTLAHDFCLKITGKTSYKGLSAEQLLLSLPLAPEEWSEKPLLKIKNKALKERLGIKTDLAHIKDFYENDGRYKLDILLNEQMNKAEDEQDKKLVRSIYDVDEQISIVNAAVTGKLIEPYKGNNPPSETRISAEILYNQLPLTVVGAFMILTGILIIVIAEIIRKKGFAVKLGILLIISAFQLAVFILRWYISGNIPLSNGYETMAFVSLSTSLLTLLAIWMLRKQTFVCNTVTIGGLMIAGLTLLVAHLSEMSPQITSLMPVLHSPWLTTHVSLIMISYSLFAFMAVIAGVDLVKKDARLDALNRLMLYPAEIFLTIGIFLGAIWANQSWGTYWSWDPKEVWALISMLIYCVPLHVGSLPVMRKAKVHDIYLIIAFLSILMTYFGVNYLLGGMHSYAGN